MASSIPLAFGFGNLAMLGWLAAAAAPIVIHLWMRHTHRDTPWAAMEFLREAIKRNARRLKLQQWLLLAVRTLLLLLLALAAAKPYLSGWNLLSSGPLVHHVLVIDASMSMQYREGEESVFERAKRAAIELVDEHRAGDVYSVLLMADPPQTVVAGPMADARRVSAQLATLEPSFGGATLADTLGSIDTAISEAEASQRDLSAHEVIIYSDLAAPTWQQGADGQPAAEQIAKLAERAKLIVMDVGNAEPTNVAVSDVRIAGTLATTTRPVRVECEVTNHSPSAASNIMVQLLVGEASVDEQTVSLAAGGSSTLAFDARFTETGWQAISVRTMGDALAADDRAWLAANVRQQVRVLLVEGRAGAARYLRHALEPGGGASPIEAVVVPEGALVETPLEAFDAIFLCNVARFTTGERELLELYTLAGGTLVLFLGDRVLSETYNEVLAVNSNTLEHVTVTPLIYANRPLSLRQVQNDPNTAEEATGSHLLPATIGPLTTSDSSGVDPRNYQHPIAAAFRGSERAGLLSTPVSRYFKLTPHQGAEVALGLPGGDPLLVTAGHGRGVVAVVATSAALDTVDPSTAQPWTMMPAWPSFLPIVRELVAYGIGESRGRSARSVGELLDGTLPSNWPNNTVSIARPDGRLDTVPIERTSSAHSQVVRWNYTSSNRPGMYLVQAGQGRAALAGAAVNVPAAESNLARVDTESLPASLELRTGGDEGGYQAIDLVANASLHRSLLYLALLLMLVEPVMAWAFAGRAA